MYKGLLITGGRVITPNAVISPGNVLVVGCRLAAIGQAAKPANGISIREISADGCWVVPGFIDLHLHGGNGSDVMDGSPDSFQRLSLFQAQHGITGFLPTTVSVPSEELIRTVKGINQARVEGICGARILGAHLEGPFLNPDYAGAHPVEYLQQPSLARASEFLGAVPGLVKIVTMAPELLQAEAVVRFFRDQGVVVAAGHTGIDFAGALKAKEWGVSHAAHLFNAMKGIHHREPGLAGGWLTEQNTSFELVADGWHVHPAVIKMALSCARGRAVLVTDAMPAAGSGDGEYLLGRMAVSVHNGVARTPNGSLAGSLLTMDMALRNVGSWMGSELPDIIDLVSLNPARVLGLEKETGSLETGKLADITLLDHNWEVRMTIQSGQVIFDRDGRL